MLNFRREQNRFNFRCAACIVQDDHLLIHREASEPFWTLPGGRVEFFETTADTVVRELQEELGYFARVERPLWFVENFFNFRSEGYHEIATIYQVSLNDSHPFESGVDFEGIETDQRLLFRWVPFSQLPNYTLYPEFLATAHFRLPDQPQFVSIDERS